jgi:hypothetical protein
MDIVSLYRRHCFLGRAKESLLSRKRSSKSPNNRPSKEMERMVIKIYRRLNLPLTQIHFFTS